MEERIKIKIGKRTYDCRLALTEEEKEIGLSRDKGLGKNEGMLFIYQDVQDEVTYTCEDMEFPIDIIFADEEGEVLSVHRMKPYDPNLVSERNVQFVLEVNVNSGIRPGDEIDGDLWEDEDFSDDEKETVKSHGKMLVLDENGNVQMELQSGERIVSRVKTRQLIKAAVKAYRTDNDADYRRVGKIILNELLAQDARDPEYVQAPAHQEGGTVVLKNEEMNTKHLSAQQKEILDYILSKFGI